MPFFHFSPAPIGFPHPLYIFTETITESASDLFFSLPAVSVVVVFVPDTTSASISSALVLRMLLLLLPSFGRINFSSFLQGAKVFHRVACL